jgi:uncharacterized protein YecE (DUF72 family)
VDTLFDEPSPVDRDKLAANLARLAREHIYIGGSSWKYEGWIGRCIALALSFARAFLRKLFESTCLEEYAATFPAVCGDFAFYQFPRKNLEAPVAQVPDGFQFAFKIPEQITCKVFPLHARYGAQGGARTRLSGRGTT